LVLPSRKKERNFPQLRGGTCNLHVDLIAKLTTPIGMSSMEVSISSVLTELSVLSKIQNRHLLNTSQKCYSLSQLASFFKTKMLSNRV
jgi:hypothetical protein